MRRRPRLNPKLAPFGNEQAQCGKKQTPDDSLERGVGGIDRLCSGVRDRVSFTTEHRAASAAKCRHETKNSSAGELAPADLQMFAGSKSHAHAHQDGDATNDLNGLEASAQP